jgi:hypothetical protein
MEILKDYFRLTESISKPQYKGILYEKVDDGFGHVILKKIAENTVVVGGGILALEHLCNATANWKPATLNEIYSINSGVAGSNASSFVALFGAGNGGCGLDFGSVVAKDIKSRDVPTLLPMRTGAALTDADAGRYYMKKDNGDGTFNWLLKELTAGPVIKTCWKDSADPDVEGTEVITEIYDSVRTEGLETFAEFNIDFNIYDIREYYESIGELDMARYNTIGLYTGQKVTLGDNSVDYVNVRLFSYINMNNKPLTDKTTSEYSYRLFSLV